MPKKRYFALLRVTFSFYNNLRPKVNVNYHHLQTERISLEFKQMNLFYR